MRKLGNPVTNYSTDLKADQVSSHICGRWSCRVKTQMSQHPPTIIHILLQHGGLLKHKM